MIDLNGVIDDEIDGADRVNLRGISAQLRDGVSHRCEVNDSRHSSEVLEL